MLKLDILVNYKLPLACFPSPLAMCTSERSELFLVGFVELYHQLLIQQYVKAFSCSLPTVGHIEISSVIITGLVIENQQLPKTYDYPLLPH